MFFLFQIILLLDGQSVTPHVGGPRLRPHNQHFHLCCHEQIAIYIPTKRTRIYTYKTIDKLNVYVISIICDGRYLLIPPPHHFAIHLW